MASYDTAPAWCIDSDWYLQTNLDVANAKLTPAYHYFNYGRKELRAPSPFFDPTWYRQFLPFPAIDPLCHYLVFGHRMNYMPCRGFKTMMDMWRASQPFHMTRDTAFCESSGPNAPISPYEMLLKSPHYSSVKSFCAANLPQWTKIGILQSDESVPLHRLLIKTDVSVDATMGGIAGAHLDSVTDTSATSSSSIASPLCSPASLTLQSRGSVVVVYLLPVDPKFIPHFQMWLCSFYKFHAGAPFELVIILKNMNQKDDRGCIREAFKLYPQLECLRAQFVVHSNEGTDIRSYVDFAKKYVDQFDRVLFLGTYSIIMKDQWLFMFENIFATNPRVTLLGTSGADEQVPQLPKMPSPNVHVRTGIFMARLTDLVECGFADIVTKLDCYEFEHGLQSLTRRMASKGAVGVVGADGTFYPPRKWRGFNVGHDGNGSNTLIIDHQLYNLGLLVWAGYRLLSHPPPTSHQWYDDGETVQPQPH